MGLGESNGLEGEVCTGLQAALAHAQHGELSEPTHDEVILFAAPRQCDADAQVPGRLRTAAGPEGFAGAQHHEHERTALRSVVGVVGEAHASERVRRVLGEREVTSRAGALQTDDGVKLGHRRVGRRELECGARQIEVRVGALGLPSRLEVDRRAGDRDRRLPLDELVRQAREQGAQRRPAAGQHDVEPALAREVGREAPFLGRNRVADGLDGVIVLGVPARRARVQLLALTAWPGREAAAQQLEEEAMAAVPLTPGIERDQEAVAPLEIGEDLPAAVRVEQRVDELPAQLVRDRGAHEEVAEVVGQGAENLACEVVGDCAVVACEVADDAARIVGLAQGERCQRERPGPAFGADDE